MTGLDKILQTIQQDADLACEKIAKEAEDKAGQILAEAKAQADAILQEQRDRDDEEKAQAGDRMRSAAALKSRQGELLERRRCIDAVLQEALQSIVQLPETEYFAALKKMILARARGENGVLQLNARDLARLPKDFMEELGKTLSAGELKLDKQPAAIGGGFVLRYGDVEENCSFEAILSADKDRLSDMVNEILFVQK